MTIDGPLVSTRSRRIEAPADVVFAVLVEPRRHPEFDGTGMLRGSDDGPIRAAGDEFLMRMHNDEFGDYLMRNRVIVFEPPHHVAWAPSREDEAGGGWDHRWGFVLEPDGDATVVTEYFDLSRSPEEAVRILKGGHRWDDDMERSLERLAALVEVTPEEGRGT